MAASKLRSRGFSLVELMIVVAIVGVLAALAIYGVRRYLSAAKSSEAKDSIGAISRTAVTVFEREQSNAQNLGLGTSSAQIAHQLCFTGQSVPDTFVPPGVKYQPVQAPGQDFLTGDGTSGWVCLNHYTVTQPIYYQYSYTHSDDLGAFKDGRSGGPGSLHRWFRSRRRWRLGWGHQHLDLCAVGGSGCQPAADHEHPGVRSRRVRIVGRRSGALRSGALRVICTQLEIMP